MNNQSRYPEALRELIQEGLSLDFPTQASYLKKVDDLVWNPGGELAQSEFVQYGYRGDAQNAIILAIDSSLRFAATDGRHGERDFLRNLKLRLALYSQFKEVLAEGGTNNLRVVEESNRLAHQHMLKKLSGEELVEAQNLVRSIEHATEAIFDRALQIAEEETLM